MQTWRALTVRVLWLLVLCGGCSATEAATEVIVVIRTDLELGTELDAVEVRLLDRDELGDDAPPDRQYSLAAEPTPGQHALPLSFSVAPRSASSSRDFRLVITGLAGGEAVVEQQAIAAFVPHRSLVLELFLARSCLDRLCRDASGQRTARACEYVSASCQEVKPRAGLPAWSGPGSEFELDAGDGSNGPDSSGVGESDGGEDEDAGPTDDADTSDTAVQPEPDADADGGSSCPLGMAASSAGCVDLDECRDPALHTCDTDPPACVDRAPDQGRFSCQCPSGYTGSGDGPDGCADLDECEAAAPPCDTDPAATCGNTRGSFSCSCPAGFGGDGKGAEGCLPVLGNLGLTSGTLTPAFDPLVTEYTARVALWRGAAQVTAGAIAGQQLSIDGTNVASNQSVSRPLALGDTRVEVKVSTGSGSRTYTLTITRGAPIERYLKASNTGGLDLFGSSVALSADGNTLAVGAPEEDSSSQGVNSTPDDAAAEAGAVYVFRRTGATWAQEAYIKPNVVHAGDEFGRSVALTSNGAGLVVGAWTEDSGSGGVNGTPDTSTPDAGAAYVFRRTGTTWSQEAYLKAPSPASNDAFGVSVAVSPDGSIIAVGAPGESTGPGATPNQDAPAAGAVFTFYNEGGGWLPYQYLKPATPADTSYFGVSVAISGDGTAMAIGAHREWTSTGGINPTPNRLAAGTGAVYVYRRDGCCAYHHEGFLKASAPGAEDTFGQHVAINGDGSIVVVGAPQEDSSTSTIDSTPNELAANAGAAYVFRRAAGSWSQDAYLKAQNAGAGDLFGAHVAVSADGSFVAVGAPFEASSTSGVNPAWNDEAARAGAVYLFRRNAGNWEQAAYLKAFNPGISNNFGYSLTLSPSGGTLVVGSAAEASSTTGVGSAPDRAAVGAGAVYVYE